MVTATLTGHTASCGRAPTQSRVAPPRSSRTSSPSGCSACRGYGDAPQLPNPTKMNFELTDDQLSIKRTARELLASRYRPQTVRDLAMDERGFTDQQWEELSQLGWPGVLVPEADGGLGLGAVELVVIQEEIGYALAPTPLLSTLSAALLLVASGSDEQRSRWLPQLAA